MLISHVLGFSLFFALKLQEQIKRESRQWLGEYEATVLFLSTIIVKQTFYK